MRPPVHLVVNPPELRPFCRNIQYVEFGLKVFSDA